MYARGRFVLYDSQYKGELVISTITILRGAKNGEIHYLYDTHIHQKQAQYKNT